MPLARPLLLTVAALTIASLLGAQQPDSVARADSLRADSVRADSIRRAELARIRGEPRLPADTVPVPRRGAAEGNGGVGSLALALTGEALADFSPRAAARGPGPRFRAGDTRIGLNARPTQRVRADVAITFRNDSAPQITTAAVGWDVAPGRLSLRAGRQPVPFGIAAPRQRVDLWFADHPLPVRAFLGQRGVRANGVLLTGTQTLAGIPFALRLGAFDRFGDRIDSLTTPEPADQSLSGLAGFARISADWNPLGLHLSIGGSAMSGKREQPIGCVYQSTIGPVPCPNAISGANTRMTVIGGDANLTTGPLSVEAEWLRNIVGATDLPVFGNPGFAPFYAGMSGTYDGAYVQLRVTGPGILRFGARASSTQNPAIQGMTDYGAGVYVGVEPVPGGRIVLSYNRRIPSASAEALLSPADRAAYDRIVLRGVYALGWLLQPGAP